MSGTIEGANCTVCVQALAPRLLVKITGTDFVEHVAQLTATFVRKYADLGEPMRIDTDPTAFETALSLSVTGLR